MNPYCTASILYYTKDGTTVTQKRLPCLKLKHGKDEPHATETPDGKTYYFPWDH